MKYHLKFAVRNLKKSAFTTLLNMVGLTSAFTAFILIMLYVWNEYHFDCYNQNANEIYRLEVKDPNNAKTSVFMKGPTGEILVNEFPEILASTTYMPWGRWGEETFTWETPNGERKSFEDYAYSDDKLTNIFSFNFLEGNKTSPLLEPQTAIISESFARKAWGNSDPIGKTFKALNSVYTITAVFDELPENSVIRCPIILKLPTTGWIAEAAKRWDIVNYPQFVLVKSGSDPKVLNEKINKQSIVVSKYSSNNENTAKAELIARPLRDLRFTDEPAETPIFSSNNQMFVNSLFLVGILIILVALINFINFATANVPKRIKSISITRIIGCSRGHTVGIMITESVILFFGAFLIGAGFSYLINEYFSALVLGYKLSYIENITLLIACGIASLIIGAIAGIFPALHSTSGKPVETIKRFNSNSKFNFRGVLTVSQFAATIALIAVSVLIIKQVRFMKETNLGFNKNSTMVIRMNSELRNNLTEFKDELKSSPHIKEVACSRAVPGQAQEMNTFDVDGKNCALWYWAVDDKYIDMMGFNIVEGRNFFNNSEAENHSIICNETAAKTFGWKPGTKIGKGQLVGILKDFNFISLREKVEPFAFWYSSSLDSFGCVSIKLSTNDVSDAITFIEKTYNEFNTEIPFQYYFLDEHLNMLYSKESQQVSLITTFSFLSVIVSILGILGLSTFICQYKIKEIGIRKVNGAKISEVLTMLNKDFIKWVAIAFVIAMPIAYYAMNKWLQTFVYKTEMSWWIFGLAGILAIGIALLTVSWQSWRAATRNPVEALRYE